MFGDDCFAPASEPNLTNPAEVKDAIQDIKVGKSPGPNGIQKRALKLPPQRALSLVAIFNEDILAQYFPAVWNYARIISILKPVKDPALPCRIVP